MTRYLVIRLPGRRRPPHASCDDNACEWAYEGARAIAEARKHTLGTGHDTVLWSTSAAWYSRRMSR